MAFSTDSTCIFMPFVSGIGLLPVLVSIESLGSSVGITDIGLMGVWLSLLDVGAGVVSSSWGVLSVGVRKQA